MSEDETVPQILKSLGMKAPDVDWMTSRITQAANTNQRKVWIVLAAFGMGILGNIALSAYWLGMRTSELSSDTEAVRVLTNQEYTTSNQLSGITATVNEIDQRTQEINRRLDNNNPRSNGS